MQLPIGQPREPGSFLLAKPSVQLQLQNNTINAQIAIQLQLAIISIALKLSTNQIAATEVIKKRDITIILKKIYNSYLIRQLI
jgi:hypothetical protein